MSATVAQIFELIDGIAPFALAEPWDNIGILAGSAAAKVDRAICALDMTASVLAEAEARDAQLIIVHHPILFRGRKNLCEDDAEGRLLAALVRSQIALIAAHTNYDNAERGVGMALCEALGVRDSRLLDSGVRIGEIEEIALSRLGDHVSAALGGVVRFYGGRDRAISRVAVLGGAGGDYADIALRAGAQAFITGEISYHDALDCAAKGMCALEAGHAETELPAISSLAKGLQIAVDRLQYNVEIMRSAIAPLL